jgi:lysophospholipase L1-like esterase
MRVLALVSAVALSLLGAVPASANGGGGGDGNHQEAGYLALGDSVAFGTDPNRNPTVASNMVGYPDYVAGALNLDEVNSSCPGEATGGFISLSGLDNVCRPYRFVFKLPLHVSYSGTQLAFAKSYLRAHRGTRLVTIDLGANDFFALEDHICHFDPTCIAAGTPKILADMEANLKTIFKALRGTGYEGLIVALTYYSLQYPDTSGAQLLNGPMIAAAAKYRVLIADGVAPFAGAAAAPANPPGAAGSTCAAGLTVVDLTTTPSNCNVHPTQLGHRLLAESILDTIAASCKAHNAERCLKRGDD